MSLSQSVTLDVIEIRSQLPARHIDFHYAAAFRIDRQIKGVTDLGAVGIGAHSKLAPVITLQLESDRPRNSGFSVNMSWVLGHFNALASLHGGLRIENAIFGIFLGGLLGIHK